MPRQDEKFMRRALQLAQAHGRYVPPNPRVGAVLVKDGRVVGEGAHSRFGGPHAEVVALRQAGAAAFGATLYVNLEPCSHQGKTPPCVEAVLAAGVKRVVASLRDPFPRVAGRGFRALKRSGVRVQVGLLGKEAALLNEDFLFSILHSRPKVLLKAAMGVDGRMTFLGGRPRWITGKKARLQVHRMRSRSDAILVGSATALKDDPSLTVRLPGYKRKDGWPLRVLLDRELRVGPRASIFQGIPRTLVFCGAAASARKEKTLSKKGIWVFRVPRKEKMLSLRPVLKVLSSLGVRVLMVEGGAKVQDSFREEGLADEVALFISPKVLGGDGPAWDLGKVLPSLKELTVEKVGDDFLLRGKI